MKGLRGGSRPPIVSRWCFFYSFLVEINGTLPLSKSWCRAGFFVASVSTPSLFSSASIFSYLPPLSCEVEHHTGSFTQPVCTVKDRGQRGPAEASTQSGSAAKTFLRGFGTFFSYPGSILVSLNLTRAIFHHHHERRCSSHTRLCICKLNQGAAARIQP